MILFVVGIFEIFPGDFKLGDVWEECWEGFEIGFPYRWIHDGQRLHGWIAELNFREHGEDLLAVLTANDQFLQGLQAQ